MPALIAFLVTFLPALMRGVVTWALKVFSVGYITKLLLGLGFGFLTFSGVDLAVDGVLSALTGIIGGLSGDVLSIVRLSGVFEALNFMISGHVSGVAVLAATRFIRRFGATPSSE